MVPRDRAVRGAAPPGPSGDTGLGIPSEVKGPLRVKVRRAGRGAEGAFHAHALNGELGVDVAALVFSARGCEGQEASRLISWLMDLGVDFI